MDKQLWHLIQDDLLSCNQRTWYHLLCIHQESCRLLYKATSTTWRFQNLFVVALRHPVHSLNLNSSPWFRGDGLDSRVLVLKIIIPHFDILQQLILQRWQMTVSSLGRVLVDALVEAFTACAHAQNSNKLTLLSLRSCVFLGDTNFPDHLSFPHAPSTEITISP